MFKFFKKEKSLSDSALKKLELFKAENELEGLRHKNKMLELEKEHERKMQKFKEMEKEIKELENKSKEICSLPTEEFFSEENRKKLNEINNQILKKAKELIRM